MAYTAPVYDNRKGWELFVYDQSTYQKIRTVGDWSSLTYTDQLNDQGSGQVTLNLDNNLLFPNGDTSLIDGEHFWQVIYRGMPMFTFMAEDIAETWVQSSQVRSVQVSGRSPVGMLDSAVVAPANWPTTQPPVDVNYTGSITGDIFNNLLGRTLTRSVAAGYASHLPLVNFVPGSSSVGANLTQTITSGTDLLTLAQQFVSYGSFQFRFDPLSGFLSPGDSRANLGGIVFASVYTPYGPNGTGGTGTPRTVAFYEGNQVTQLVRNRSRRTMKTAYMLQGGSGLAAGVQIDQAGSECAVGVSGGFGNLPGNPYMRRSGPDWREVYLVDSSGLSSTGQLTTVAQQQVKILSTQQASFSATINAERSGPDTGVGGFATNNDPIPGITFAPGDQAVFWFNGNTESAQQTIQYIAATIDDKNANATFVISCGEPVITSQSLLWQAAARTDTQFRLQGRRRGGVRG